MNTDTDYSLIRPNIRESLDNYVNFGYHPGGFLTAVLENNLSEAIARADLQNLETLPALVSYVYNEMPRNCWGNPKFVTHWLNSHA